MAWSITSWLNADWSSLSGIGELWAAVNERRTARGLGLYHAVAAGDIVQRTFTPGSPDPTLVSSGSKPNPTSYSLQALQSQVFGLVPSFVQSHDMDGTYRDPTCYEGSATIDLWTLANMTTSLYGASKTYPRRATTMPTDWTDPDDAAFSYDAWCQPGDIIGPWIFYDLQWILNRLVWLTKTCQIPVHDRMENDSGANGAFGTSWAAAKTAAETNFAGESVQNSSADSIRHNTHGDKGNAVVWWAKITAEETVMTTTMAAVACDVYWYAKASEPYGGAVANSTFDADSSGLLEDQYVNWYTEAYGGAGGSLTSGALLGYLTAPATWVDEPASTFTDYERGWHVYEANTAALCDFSFTYRE